MEKLFYSVGEVAEMLGESTSLVRFWANSFPKFIKPSRTNKGNRQFTKDDIVAFKQIHLLVKGQGMTLEGAAKRLSGEIKEVDGKVKVLESLKAMRTQLEEIKKTL